LPEELNQIETEPTKNAEANQNYILANSISYNAWSSFNMANNYLEAISFSSAIDAYDKAIKEDSLFARAYAKRAIARAWGYNAGQLDSTQIRKCMEDIIKASEINKDLPETQIALGFYYYYCKRELDKALEYFTLAYEKAPGDYEPLFYVAMVYRRRAEWVKSMNLIKKLIAIEPQNALCLTNIGMTYQYLHNYDSAQLFHQKAIEVMPVWPSSYRNMIETLILKHGNTLEARITLNNGIKTTGGDFTEFLILLDIYDRKYADALQIAEKSHQNEYKFNGKKQLYIAEINSLMNNKHTADLYYDSALVILNNTLKNKNDNPEIISNMGIAYAGKGNKEVAISEGQKAISLFKYDNFDKSDMILNLARICTMVGEYEQAISYIDYLLHNIPSNCSMKLLQLDPVWEPLTNRQEFKTLQRKSTLN
jgi:tetratricopeptide (TPR) repeat protein